MNELNELIDRYFNFLSKEQVKALELFLEYLVDWNKKVNLVSRNDIDNLVERHLLPSLAIARICKFSAGAEVLDVGTGGGFPGIPLAICFPEASFLLIDSIGKKVQVVQAIVQSLGLKNVRAMQIRVEDLNEKFDFVVGRAVTALPKFIGWVKPKIRQGSGSELANGVLYLKGGDFSEEIKELGIVPTATYPLEPLFDGAYGQDKCVIYFQKEALSRI